MNNPYALLEIEKNATEEEIRKAVINQIRKYCKDNHQDNKYLIEIFVNAGDLLLDPIKKKEIDGILQKEETRLKSTSVHQQEDLEELKDVRDTFICVYDDHQVGLFKRIAWTSNQIDIGIYDAGDVFVGLDTDYIGIHSTHDGSVACNDFEKMGVRAKVLDSVYTANCDMKESIHFEDMRLMMYQEEKIGPYERGRATSKEMLDTLCYAKGYYQDYQKGKAYKK